MRIYLALDPETQRVTAQLNPFNRVDFPPGLRGKDWPLRECDIPEQTWTKMLRAEYAPDEQDRLHRSWWDQAEL